MPNVEDRVKAVVARVLRVPVESIVSSHYFARDLGAQSIQSVELVASFEEEFGLEFDEEAALAVETVGGAVKFITEACAEDGIQV